MVFVSLFRLPFLCNKIFTRIQANTHTHSHSHSHRGYLEIEKSVIHTFLPLSFRISLSLIHSSPLSLGAAWVGIVSSVLLHSFHTQAHSHNFIYFHFGLLSSIPNAGTTPTNYWLLLLLSSSSSSSSPSVHFEYAWTVCECWVFIAGAYPLNKSFYFVISHQTKSIEAHHGTSLLLRNVNAP